MRRISFQERHPRIWTLIHVALLAYIIGGAICFAIAMLRAS